MNSKKLFSWVTKFVAVAGASLVFASLASAQDFQGKFTLNHQAQWGAVVLQPGSYTLTLTRALRGGRRLVKVRSEGKAGPTMFVLPSSHDLLASSVNSDLVCIRESGMLIIRALEIGPLGDAIYFPMPKGAQTYAQRRNSEEQTLLAGGPQLIERVQVARTGN